jgi:hypothetical protein
MIYRYDVNPNIRAPTALFFQSTFKVSSRIKKEIKNVNAKLAGRGSACSDR